VNEKLNKYKYGDKKMKKIIKKYAKMAIGVVLGVSLIACSKESPLSLQKSSLEDQLNSNIKTTDQIKFLKAKTPRLAKILEKSQLITANVGGLVRIGDYETGYSGVKFLPGNLQEDTTINIWWDSQNFQAEFSPHGITFNEPVLMRLSYKDADLGDIDENSLRIWYYNEINDVWEIIGNEVNTDAKYVQGYTTHFSRYAVGGE
jgi:hypothetical protein